MGKKSIILASKSPRRRERMENAGSEFAVMEAETDETVKAGMPPPEAVADIAMRKAVYVRERVSDKNTVIIAADTMVCIGDELLGKPKDAEDAFRMLRLLSDNWHEVYTGYAVISGDRVYSGCEKTSVKFRYLTNEEINGYIQSGQPFDKAGAYGVQDRASVFVERIEGDFFNVMGLPVCKISQIIGLESST